MDLSTSPAASSTSDAGSSPPPDAAPATPRWQRYPGVALGLTALFAAFTLLPRVRDNPRLSWSFLGGAACLLAWESILWLRARRRPRSFPIDFVPGVKSHYVQASVQLCIYAYWGWYWRDVYAEAPLILAQLVFLYTFDALVSWSRGRRWRLGFGPLPIILSSNVFIWFKDDWYFFQFLLIATGVLGKEFITWKRDGRTTHIFNPSAFALGTFSIILIATQTTQYTRGIEIAATLALPPYIYLEIFLLGLVVQYLFSVTLMTLSAAAVLYLCNLIYTRTTGVYEFVDTNIPIAIFLGLHLLVTDPSTSPRTNLGRVIFGGLYGLANWVLYDVLAHFGVPEFYDKLLPVPILNLSVQVIDALARGGILGKLTRWETKFLPMTTNLGYMACWSALFAAMFFTGFVEAPHPGASIGFWKKAYADGKPHAAEKLLKVIGAQAEAGSAPACNEMAIGYMDGKIVPEDHAAAAHYFARAAELGDPAACGNVAIQFLFLHEGTSDEDVAKALAALERACAQSADGRSCYLLGFAYETGRGRAMDKARALELYEHGCERGDLDACKSVARVRCSEASWPAGTSNVAQILERARDAESCMYLGYMHHAGLGVPRSEERAQTWFDRACELGSRASCAARGRADAPPVPSAPPTAMPRWCGEIAPLP